MAGSSDWAALRLAARVTALLALPWLGACDGKGSNQAAAPAPPPVTVAHPLVKKITDWDEYTGRFEPTESVEVRARVSGYLESVHFKDGQMVDKDQLLFVIDPRPFQLAVERAKADVESAQARLKLATLESDRAGKLVNTSALSQSTYDQRFQEKQSAAGALASAQAAVKQAERFDLYYTNVTSPIAGRASNRRVDVGNFVSGGGATLLTTVVSLDPIYFVFDATESDYLRYQQLAREGLRQSSRDVANPVFVRLSDEKGWPHQGQMNFVDNVVDRSSGTIRGRAVFANADSQFTAGTFGRLRLLGSGEYEAILIPDEAIVADQSRKLVMTVGADGTVQPKPIEVGPLADGLRVVRSGLSGDDRIVIDGLLRARPGGKVTPKDGTIQAAAG